MQRETPIPVLTRRSWKNILIDCRFWALPNDYPTNEQQYTFPEVFSTEKRADPERQPSAELDIDLTRLIST